MARLLEAAFYAGDALDVARALLGMHIHSGDVVLRITEVEAYRHPGDSASHCRMGMTKRNAPMWGPPGHAYVYLCYGMHNLLNFVTGLEGEGAAVLIRACEPVSGHSVIGERRGGKTSPIALAGPGKVTAALGIDRSATGLALFRKGPIEVRVGRAPKEIASGPRIGIGYASREHQRAPWRLADAESEYVTERKGLRRE